MGGIAGMVHFKKNFIAYKSYNTLLVRDMADSLSARGASGGEWVGEHTALACRYSGDGQKQPLTRIVGGYEFVLVLDGSLYGTDGIYRELQKFGYRFETGDDAELLLYAYIHYGADCAKLLDGVYAFCVWDSMRQQIFACRDRVGAKPFYYLYQDENFLFSSAIRALFRHPSVKPQIDADGLRAILSAGARLPQGGIFTGVEELLPAHSLILNRSGLRIRPYWECPVREHIESVEETASHITELFTESIRQSVTGTAPAVILTGRPGSNLLAAMADRETGDRLATCSFELKNSGRYYKPSILKSGSDRLYIERMIEELDSCHHYCSATAAELNCLLPDTTALLDLPGMAFDDAAMLYFFRETAKEHMRIMCDAGFDLAYAANKPKVHPEASLAGLLLPAVAETLDIAGDMSEISHYPMPALTSMLAKLDRLCAGAEIQIPFCRRGILEYIQHIPEDMKKDVFHKVAEPYLQPDVLEHESLCRLNVNSAYYAEILKNDVLAVLEDSRAPALAFFDGTAVRELADNIQNCTQAEHSLPAAERLSAFLQINSWLALYNPRLV